MVFGLKICNFSHYSFIESIIESVDKGKPCVGIFLDMSRAFYSINHSVLLEKLKKKLGVETFTLWWFGSYLFEKYQFVGIKHSQKNFIVKVQSNLELIRYYGVPQGSILGSVLFLC